MANDQLLLSDGVSNLLLSDGVSVLLLSTSGGPELDPTPYEFTSVLDARLVARLDATGSTTIDARRSSSV